MAYLPRKASVGCHGRRTLYRGDAFNLFNKKKMATLVNIRTTALQKYKCYEKGNCN